MTLARWPSKFLHLFAPYDTTGIVIQLCVLARSRAPFVAAAGWALALGLSACSEDPFAFDWYDSPDTTYLYSLKTPVDRQLGAGFNFRERSPVRIETAGATGTWDVALDTQGGELVLLPPGALGISSRAAIATIGAVPFADVKEAPGDTLAYNLLDPVPMELNYVYVVRTNRQVGAFGSTCVYYAKMSPVALDPLAGSMQFEFVISPVCNSRDLVSPE